MKNKKKQATWRYFFAAVVIALGIFLNLMNVGNEFLGFESVGTWLVYVGFIMVAIITLQLISNKKRIVDERMVALSYKATRVTFVLMIFAAFAIMILDGIKPIEIPYSFFMSYLIAFMMLVYFISYKIIERYY